VFADEVDQRGGWLGTTFSEEGNLCHTGDHR
jgi:hypothetical protein